MQDLDVCAVRSCGSPERTGIVLESIQGFRAAGLKSLLRFFWVLVECVVVGVAL